ncbi:MAG: hypothetical protein ACPGJS_12605 [Flammeovirgaceae bacterium]
MYSFLLSLHSGLRWVVLVALVVSVVWSFMGWFGKKPFTGAGKGLRLGTMISTHIQFLTGLILYTISPIIKSFLSGFPETMGDKALRFYGMEHSVMMLLAVVVITIGSVKAKKKTDDLGKYKTMAIWFLVGLVFILAGMPWDRF